MYTLGWWKPAVRARYNRHEMQVVQAGPHKYILLELEAEVLFSIAKQTGFECKLEEGKLALALELAAPGRA